MRRSHLIIPTVALLLCGGTVLAQKPPITLDEFFNAVDIRNVRISPDGRAVVIETSHADWDRNRFRSDLWLYRDEGEGSLIPLTQSAHDTNPKWSPNGNAIAFLSDRGPTEAGKDPDGPKEKSEPTEQVYVIPISGGEAFPITRGEEKVHAFAWSTDSRHVYFATRTPWSKQPQEAYKLEWNDSYSSGNRSAAM
jgi:dipeptidyl aminopeptidase/acylaminoacyl peptidase